LKSVHFNKPALTKENDVFPQGVFPETFESWAFLIAACAIGLFVGQWISHRRGKKEAEKAAYTKMVST
jgi:hypothetical protein